MAELTRALTVIGLALLALLASANPAGAEPLRCRPVQIATAVEPCESCGTRVAITIREDDGARRLSEIGPGGRVYPGGHTPGACQIARGRGQR